MGGATAVPSTRNPSLLSCPVGWAQVLVATLQQVSVQPPDCDVAFNGPRGLACSVNSVCLDTVGAWSSWFELCGGR
jgi:hypothetical protein